jgi:hypothetical protein
MYSSNVVFKIARKLFKGRGEKVKFYLRPSNIFCLFIGSYQAILKYYWRVLNVILKKSPINIISPKPYIFNLTERKMVNTIVHQRTSLKVKKVEVLRQKNLILSRDPVPLTIIKACNF